MLFQLQLSAIEMTILFTFDRLLVQILYISDVSCFYVLFYFIVNRFP